MSVVGDLHGFRKLGRLEYRNVENVQRADPVGRIPRLRHRCERVGSSAPRWDHVPIQVPALGETLLLACCPFELKEGVIPSLVGRVFEAAAGFPSTTEFERRSGRGSVACQG